MKYPITILKRPSDIPLDVDCGDFLFGHEYIHLLESKDLIDNEILLLIHL